MKSIIPLVLFVAALCLESAEGFSNNLFGNRQKPCPTTSTNCRTMEVTTSSSPIIFGSKSCNALRSSAKDSADLTAATDDKYSNDNSDSQAGYGPPRLRVVAWNPRPSSPILSQSRVKDGLRYWKTTYVRTYSARHGRSP